MLTWKNRAITKEQTDRMMAIWGKIEADMAADPNIERVGWFMYTDGSGGCTITKSPDIAQGIAFEAEVTLSMSEFFEFESKMAMDLDEAMPVIMKSLERYNA